MFILESERSEKAIGSTTMFILIFLCTNIRLERMLGQCRHALQCSNSKSYIICVSWYVILNVFRFSRNCLLVRNSKQSKNIGRKQYILSMLVVLKCGTKKKKTAEIMNLNF